MAGLGLECWNIFCTGILFSGSCDGCYQGVARLPLFMPFWDPTSRAMLCMASVFKPTTSTGAVELCTVYAFQCVESSTAEALMIEHNTAVATT